MGDANARFRTGQKVANALRFFGCSVLQLTEGNWGELLVGYRGRNFIITTQTNSERLDVKWTGQATRVRDPDEAVRVVMALTHYAETGVSPDAVPTILK